MSVLAGIGWTVAFTVTAAAAGFAAGWIIRGKRSKGKDE